MIAFISSSKPVTLIGIIGNVPDINRNDIIKLKTINKKISKN
jgi:hypothetical protein